MEDDLKMLRKLRGKLECGSAQPSLFTDKTQFSLIKLYKEIIENLN